MSRLAKRVSVAVLAVTLAFSATVSVDALEQDQIDSILSLLQSFGADAETMASVEGALTGETPSTPSTGGGIEGVPAGFMFNTNLSQGAQGDEVRYLQIVMNSEAATQVAASGPGAPAPRRNAHRLEVTAKIT